MAASANAEFKATLEAAQQDVVRRLGDAKAEREADAQRRADAGELLSSLFARLPAADAGPVLSEEEAQAVLDAETAAERRERARTRR